LSERDSPTVDPLALPDSPELALPPPATEAAGERAGELGRFLAGVGVFSLVQGLTQLLALGAGILWVRALAKDEYALYTLANSVLALAAVLTDLGAGSALHHYFHRLGGDGEPFSSYLAAVRGLRRWLALGVLPVLLVLLATQVGGRAVSLGAAMALLVLVLLSSLVQQESVIRLTVLRLLGRWRSVYRSEVVLAAIRFVAAGLALAARAGSALVALAANLLATLVGTALARLPGASRPGGARSERREVLRYLAPIVPDTVYYALQGQLVVWLAALAGGSAQVAEVGALTRIGLLFAIPQNLAGSYLVPKLAGRHGEAEFRTATLRYGAFLVTIAACALVVSWLWPAPFLALLGRDYKDLDEGLRLVVAASAAWVLGGFCVQVNRTRGWTSSVWMIIVVAVAGQIAFAARFPLSSTLSVLRLGVVAAGLLSAGHLCAMVVGLVRGARAGSRNVE
jgi:O-antigen/teichoic acid export membrane protein